MYILIAILIFGVLITVHELGHFVAAKLCGVRVLEFAIGMGPALFQYPKGKKTGEKTPKTPDVEISEGLFSGETVYSLRALPIGGYCAMEGEDDASDDPRAFSNQKAWKRVIILVAGAAMNFISGFIILLVIIGNLNVAEPVITGFFDDCPYQGESGLMVGDEFYSIDGHRTYFSANISKYLNRGGEVKDIVVIRDGKKVHLEDYKMPLVEYTMEDGTTDMKFGITPNPYNLNNTGLARIKNTWHYSVDLLRLVWDGLVDLVSGNVGLRDMSGVVGIVGAINDVGQQAETPAIAAHSIAFFTAFISINLAVMNLLPIPAVDGGRLFLLAVIWIFEKIFKRKPDPKYEGYIHAAGFILLMGLMLLVTINDIVKIFTA